MFAVNSRTVNQIDYVCISQRWASSVQDSRVHRGGDVGSDHYLVITVMKVKLKSLAKKQGNKVLDTGQLRKTDKQQQFSLELNNRFSLLEHEHIGEETSVEEEWAVVKETVQTTAQKVIGYRRGSRKEQCISEGTWKAIDERRELKARKEQALGSGNKADEAITDYRIKDKEVKSRCRADKEMWIAGKLADAEEAADKGNSKTLYQIVKDLSGKTGSKVPIVDTAGRPLKSQEEQAKRWKEHFHAVLNCPEPDVLHDFSQDCMNSLDIEIGDVTMEEVERVIKRLKNGKAAGIDGIQAELLKHGGGELAKRITKLCNKIWTTGEIPQDWRDGIIIPLPKKGDLRDCNNWRGITLLSVPGKVMAGIILNRIKDAVDEVLRQQQAGFRKGRSCCEQIFALRQIIEKAIALDSNLLITFIDFKKAFDCVHRPSVWNILRSYGIPDKIIGIIQNFYKDSRCAVRADGQQGEWFQIVTGVRQGCLLSPLIFLLVVDWILKRSTSNNECGLPWNEGQTLTDLDFADDIAVLEKTRKGMQELISRVEMEAGTVGLRMNAGKTKVMMIGHVDPGPNIQAEGSTIEEVTEFCYLGSVLSHDSSCDKDIKTRLGKANSNFGRLHSIWRSKTLSIKIKVRLYESLILSTLLYAAETWPMTVTNMKKLEAAHHRWQRRILGIIWKDKVTNEEVRRKTGLEKLEVILKRRRLRWWGHLQRMSTNRISKQALHWAPADGRRKRGRPKKNWKSTITDDLKDLGMVWEEAEQTAEDRAVWHSCVARCAAGTRRN